MPELVALLEEKQVSKMVIRTKEHGKETLRRFLVRIGAVDVSDLEFVTRESLVKDGMSEMQANKFATLVLTPKTT